MKFRVKVDMSGAERKIGKLKGNSSLGAFYASTLAKMMRPYIPERDSILINSYTAAPWMLTYDTPYARAMYYGKVKGRPVRFHKATARTKWDTHVDKVDFARQVEAYTRTVL